MASQHIQPRARVIARAASAFGLTFEDVASQSRRAINVKARWVAIWVIRERWPDFSYNMIGNLLGGRDHTTIYHSLCQARLERESDPRFRAICDMVLAEREPLGPPAPVVVPEPTPERVAVIARRRELDEADDLDRDWTAALAAIRRGSRDLLAAIRASHPERLAA